ncbi:dermatopontin-like [Anneissia japonica]|uniref:dermatopontin-like n=1 Tax=Anneissia japonica TaxID=1529436 RepID=UPI001425B210|nr:dermatopontin-like [Anneissia japonica]
MKVVLGLVVLLYAFCMATAETADWHNDYDQPVNFTCPKGQAIYKVISVHNDKKEDRLFEFFCRPLPADCSQSVWTGYINDFDQPFASDCPYSGIIIGAYSYHVDKHEDRRWMLNCCESEHSYTVNCYTTPYAHTWDGYHEYSAPSDYWIHGVAGQHSNKKEDRLWQYKVCQVRTT